MVSESRDRFKSGLAVIEVKFVATNDLICLVALAGDNNDVACTGRFDGRGDRFTAIRNAHSFGFGPGYTCFDIGNDL